MKKLKKAKNKFELSDNQNLLIGILGISLSFIFVIMSLFFQLQNQFIEFVVFLIISFWLFSISMSINFTKQILKSFLFITALYLLLLLSFAVSLPFLITAESDILIIIICVDFVIGLFLDFIFAYCAIILPRNKKLNFINTNSSLIRQSNEIQTTFASILFNEKGDRACVIKVNNQKYIVRIEKLNEIGYYMLVAEHYAKSLLNAKVIGFEELLLLNKDSRKALKVNNEAPKSESLKKLMSFFNKKLKKDGNDEMFLTSSYFDTYYKKEYIYIKNKKDKSLSIEIFEDNGLYFCLLGVREILPENITKEEIYEIIKMVLQGKLIYVLNKKKTNLTSTHIYEVYDLRKLNAIPKLLKLKILFSKKFKTWTQHTAKHFLKEQIKQKRYIYDISNYCKVLNEKLTQEKIGEIFVAEKKLIGGKIRKVLHASNKSNLTKQADIFISNNLIKFKFIFSFVTAPVLLDFEANTQIMFDFVSQLFLDKVVFHYKLNSDEKMYEKGMFLLDKNNEFKESIQLYLQSNSNVNLMVWSDLDAHVLQSQVYETFK